MARAWLVICTLSLVAVACGRGDSERAVLVFAAASLTDAFAEIEAAYEAEHPDVDIQVNVAGSSALREQILEGAPADVFASADELIMGQVVDAGFGTGEPRIFATNRLQLAVPAGNPGEVRGLADVGDEDLLVGVCAVTVPCGRFATEVFARAGVEAAPDTTEPDVRALLTKLATDELDVGVVYATDVIAADGEVEGLEIADDVNIEARYPILALTGSDQANDFVDFVASGDGQAILVAQGFGTP
ncbi:MAG: molybdate ABC transporter substrate-binding protein [Actinomycetota bacterium]